jgi:hypothetical protein
MRTERKKMRKNANTSTREEQPYLIKNAGWGSDMAIVLRQ